MESSSSSWNLLCRRLILFVMLESASSSSNLLCCCRTHLAIHPPGWLPLLCRCCAAVAVSSSWVVFLLIMLGPLFLLVLGSSAIAAVGFLIVSPLLRLAPAPYRLALSSSFPLFSGPIPLPPRRRFLPSSSSRRPSSSLIRVLFRPSRWVEASVRE
jgi:hypothetical protein